ncbi:hypothetical protein AVEN_68176-1 [Araneus ventricosus]|uniref:HTH CENPB-type domain-containing protein n=1 Tax=Araneus ventricosus TaxID=182803 RepID=A0A4Y2UGI4_ARAVE|nr:hypothetical protein AVEN_68176-1 [Araneus ventricosus]
MVILRIYLVLLLGRRGPFAWQIFFSYGVHLKALIYETPMDSDEDLVARLSVAVFAKHPASLKEYANHLLDALVRNRDFSTRVILTVEEKYDTVTRLGSGETVTKLAKGFNVGVSTVGDMKRNSEKTKKICAELDSGKSDDQTDSDAALYKWFVQERCEGISLSVPITQEKALVLNSKFCGSDDFKASSGWLEKFKIRQGQRRG